MAGGNFYSGSPATSFVVRNSFETIKDMVAAGQQGSNYTDVWYGEYCIIDTPNKNDKHNGEIYKRGLNFQNSMGGWLRLGQIVGPSGGTPYIAIDSIDEMQTYGNIELEDYEYRRFPTGRNDDGTYEIAGENEYEEQPSGTPAVFDLNENENHGIRPGKYTDDNGTVQYNDTIQYTWVNIRKDNNESDSWFYVGFSYPYTVLEYTISTNSPYDSNGNRLRGTSGGDEDPTSVERTDDMTHPYYEQWNLGTPHGIKGDAIRNLRVTTPTTDDVIYDITSLNVNAVTGEADISSLMEYSGKQDDIDAGRQIVVFDCYIYDNVINPDPITFYVGDFNIITDISVADDGTLTVQYTHDDDTVQEGLVKWVENMTLSTGTGTNGGVLTIQWNNKNVPYQGDNPDVTFDICWVRSISVEDNGDVVFTFAGTPDRGMIPSGAVRESDGVYRVNNLIRWETDVSLDTNDGHYTIDFNYGDSYETYLDWVKEISFDYDTGDVTVTHTVDSNTYTNSGALKLINNASISDDGIITFYFNNGTTTNITLPNTNNQTDFHLKWITNITINTGIADDKRFVITYNTGDIKTIGDPINFIQQVVVNPSDFHLFVLYSDPSHRASVSDDGTITPPSNSGTTASDWKSDTYIHDFLGSSTTIPSYGAGVMWRDFGAIKDDHGVLVGLDVDDSWMEYNGTSYTNILDMLNARWPYGLNSNSVNDNETTMGQAVAQKIVTYVPNPDIEEKQDREFYAYDYNKSSWYYLGTLNDTGNRDVLLATRAELTGENALTFTSKLNTRGLIFEIIPTAYSDTAIPEYWTYDYNGWV